VDLFSRIKFAEKEEQFNKYKQFTIKRKIGEVHT